MSHEKLLRLSAPIGRADRVGLPHSCARIRRRPRHRGWPGLYEIFVVGLMVACGAAGYLSLVQTAV